MYEENTRRVLDLLARRHVDPARVLLVSETGSTAHGIGALTDDLDATVVRIEDFAELVCGHPDRQSMMIRTKPDGVRSEKGDIDLQVYTLRKFANLAAKGNPSILTAIFSPARYHSQIEPALWEDLADLIASKRAGHAFLGYMRQQIERWTGERGQKNVNRPELVEAYGFDTKYAAHVIRLGYQGIEYMATGRFEVPMQALIAAEITKLRRGGFTEAEALDWATTIEAQLKTAIDTSLLPPNPEPIDDWLLRIYRRF